MHSLSRKGCQRTRAPDELRQDRPRGFPSAPSFKTPRRVPQRSTSLRVRAGALLRRLGPHRTAPLALAMKPAVALAASGRQRRCHEHVRARHERAARGTGTARRRAEHAVRELPAGARGAPARCRAGAPAGRGRRRAGPRRGDRGCPARTTRRRDVGRTRRRARHHRPGRVQARRTARAPASDVSSAPTNAPSARNSATAKRSATTCRRNGASPRHSTTTGTRTRRRTPRRRRPPLRLPSRAASA